MEDILGYLDIDFKKRAQERKQRNAIVMAGLGIGMNSGHASVNVGNYGSSYGKGAFTT